jgi:hypothetical protein
MISFDDLREKLRALESMSVEKARKVLLDPGSPAVLLYVAARAFYGPTVATYEPDSLWVQLDVPLLNRDKLMAALTLQVNPQFYWDIRVFGQSCLAFNDQAPHTELVPQPVPEHLAAAIFEAQLLFQLDTETTPEFDDEVAAYVAACLAHEGLVYAPPLMGFAEEHLERILSPVGRKLGVEMKKIAGEEHPKVDPESALGVQLARYEQIGAYVTVRRADVTARIAAIS